MCACGEPRWARPRTTSASFTIRSPSRCESLHSGCVHLQPHCPQSWQHAECRMATCTVCIVDRDASLMLHVLISLWKCLRATGARRRRKGTELLLRPLLRLHDHLCHPGAHVRLWRRPCRPLPQRQARRMAHAPARGVLHLKQQFAHPAAVLAHIACRRPAGECQVHCRRAQDAVGTGRSVMTWWSGAACKLVYRVSGAVPCRSSGPSPS